MPHYKAIFRLPGDKELEARRGYVPDEFFKAIQKVTVNDIVEIYEDGFVLTTEMHEKLNIPGSFTSYASVGSLAVGGSDKDPDFHIKLLERLKIANHARPLEIHYNYQIFIMEYIEEAPEDD
jgi:hypothetical protein